LIRLPPTVGLLACLLFVSACAPVPAKPVPWRHGVVGVGPEAGYLLMAREKGYFEQHGVAIEYVTLENDAVLLDRLIAGELDSAEADPGPVIDATARGGDLKIIGATLPGTLDAGGEPGARQLRRGMLVSNGSALKNTPRDAIVGFLAAHMQGLRAALDEREEALVLCGRVIGSTPSDERCTGAYDRLKAEGDVDPNLDLDVARLTRLQEQRVRLGQQRQVLPVEKFVDLSFRDDALKKVGRTGQPSTTRWPGFFAGRSS
jgi:ABC-type nitrate/sulfonate/bicarbonate transport system substrate-binding protein